jgi:hypothetical protein
MATQAQIDANRRNSLKSTGPRTDAGKAAASRNAVTHGLWAGDAVIAGEDPAEFAAFAQRLWAAFQPRGVLQGCIVERLTHLYWKLRRIPGLEAATVRELLALHADPAQPPAEATREQVATAMAKDVAAPASVLRRLQMHEMRIEQAIRANTKELRRLQEQGEDADADEAMAVETAAPAAASTDAADEAPATSGTAPEAVAARNEANSATSPLPGGNAGPVKPPHPALIRAVTAVALAG